MRPSLADRLRSSAIALRFAADDLPEEAVMEAARIRALADDLDEQANREDASDD